MTMKVTCISRCNLRTGSCNGLIWTILGGEPHQPNDLKKERIEVGGKRFLFRRFLEQKV